MTRFAYVLSAYFASMATVITAFVHPLPRLIWNASASVPIGLYALDRAATPRVGDLVAVSPPKQLAIYLADRRYLPLGLPLLKHVAARSGQKVCRTGRRIEIDGRLTGFAFERDSRGRPLPVWHGCLTLAAGQVFLLNNGVRDSFDGRYFRALPVSTISGRLLPVWTH